MQDRGEMRPLAPDTKWLMQTGGGILAAVLAALMGITQYQMGTIRAQVTKEITHIKDLIEAKADLATYQAKSNGYDRDTVWKAFAAQNKKHEATAAQIGILREDKAAQSERLNALGERLERVLRGIQKTQKESADKLTELLQQQATETALLKGYMRETSARVERLEELSAP